MSRRRQKAKALRTILIAVALFFGVLAASVVIQLYASPDFKGFSRDPAPDPTVTIHTGADGQEAQEGQGPFNWKDHQVFVIGDSLTQGARKEIGKAIDNATVDGKVGRTMAEGVQILQDWKESGVLTYDAIIVICLANNITGTTLQDAQTIVDMIEPGQSLIMMTGHGLSNMAPANELIRSFPNTYNFVTLAD